MNLECCICYKPVDSQNCLEMKHEGKSHSVHFPCIGIFQTKLNPVIKDKNPLCPWCSDKIIQVIPNNKTNEVKKDALPPVKSNSSYIRPFRRDFATKPTNSDSHFVPIKIHDTEVLDAVKSGDHIKVIEWLTTGPITNKTCGEAIILATQNNYSLVVNALIDHRKENWEHIPPIDLKKAIEIAKKNNYQEIVSSLNKI